MDAWRRIISGSFVPLDARQVGDGAFAGEVLQHSFGSILLARVSASASSVLRTPRLIRSSSDDFFLVTVHLGGGRCQVEQDGRVATQQIGDLVAYDTTRPYELTFGDHQLIVIQVPAAQLRRVIPMEDLVVRTISAAEPSLRVLRSYLSELFRVAPELGDIERSELGATALELLITVFQVDHTATTESAALAKARSYLASHLSDPDLSVQRLAVVAGVSPRHLSRLFAAQACSPAQYILDVRLQAARRLLADPRYRHLTVAAVGHKVGLLDPTVFGRAFRRRFGMPPSEFRAGGQVAFSERRCRLLSFDAPVDAPVDATASAV